MRATASCLGALLALGLTASAGFSQYYSPARHTPLGYAPDACYGGFYTVCPDGTAFGPNYNVRPPFEPFQGYGAPGGRGRPGVGGAMGGPQPPLPPVFRYNPYVRSPRDFFMWGDMMEDQIARERRPALVP